VGEGSRGGGVGGEGGGDRGVRKEGGGKKRMETEVRAWETEECYVNEESIRDGERRLL